MTALSVLSDSLLARSMQVKPVASAAVSPPESSGFLATLQQLEAGWDAAFSAGKMRVQLPAIPANPGAPDPQGSTRSLVAQFDHCDQPSGASEVGPGRAVAAGMQHSAGPAVAAVGLRGPLPREGRAGLMVVEDSTLKSDAAHAQLSRIDPATKTVVPAFESSASTTGVHVVDGTQQPMIDRPVGVFFATHGIVQSAKSDVVEEEGAAGKFLPLPRANALAPSQSSGPSVSVTEVQGGLAISVWSPMDAQKLTPALRQSITDEVARHGSRLARIHVNGHQLDHPTTPAVTQE